MLPAPHPEPSRQAAAFDRKSSPMPRLLIALLLLQSPVTLAGQTAVDTTGAGALIAQAMDHSEVMANLRQLSDVIGPRLSGTGAMRRANDWTAERFRAYGLSARLEPYTFGITWQRGSASLRLVAPFPRKITANSWAWNAGTGGRTLAGPVVLADLSTPDSVAAYKSKVRGAWVLPRSAAPVWNPDGPPMTADDSTRLTETLRLRGLATADTSAAAVRARRQFVIDLPYILRAAGALGTLGDGAKEHALMTMSGSRAHGSKAGWTTRSGGCRCSSGTRWRRFGAGSGRGRW